MAPGFEDLKLQGLPALGALGALEGMLTQPPQAR